MDTKISTSLSVLSSMSTLALTLDINSACLVIFHAFLVICHLFSKLTFSKKNKKTFRVANGLDTDQDQLFVRPDLGPNCLQRLSAEDKRKECKSMKTYKYHVAVALLVAFSLSKLLCQNFCV